MLKYLYPTNTSSVYSTRSSESWKVAVDGYDIAGKTGTAEKFPRNQGNYLLSFAGYAPADNPEIAIYVVIDEANSDNQSNSAFVLDLTREILEEALPYLDVTRNDQ